jgi:anti-anti-sigma factor
MPLDAAPPARDWLRHREPAMSDNGLIIDRQNDVSVVKFQGIHILDIATSQGMAGELLALTAGPSPPKVVVDLSSIRLVASRVLGILVEMTKKAQAARGKVVVCGLHKDVKQVLRNMRLDRLLTLVKDQPQAMGVLAEMKE